MGRAVHMLRKIPVILLYGVCVIIAFFGSCQAISGASAGAAGAGPGEGHWRPILFQPGESMTLPPPPAADSAQTRQELEQLRMRQARRSPERAQQAREWYGSGVLRWNAYARQLVSAHQTNPPMASRVYALLSVAQYDALLEARANQARYPRHAPATEDRSIHASVPVADGAVYPDTGAVIAGVSSNVLTSLYPDQARAIADYAREEMDAQLWAGAAHRSDVIAGAQLGAAVAAYAISYAQRDGADRAWDGRLPTGPGIWYSSAVPPEPPILPLWGTVHPWLMTSGDQFRPGPPPAFGSPAFLAAVREVRRISDTRTPRQVAIARFWEDGSGTPTPAGHWNRIAADLIVRHRWGELRAARALALLNMAEMDASISCWDTKYTYWLCRPTQVDHGITMPVGLPNFPAYDSGHAAFSGAASTILGYLFPEERAQLRAMAEEAGMSRIYGGIHYPFDSSVGLAAGRKVGQLAITRAQSDG